MSPSFSKGRARDGFFKYEHVPELIFGNGFAYKYECKFALKLKASRRPTHQLTNPIFNSEHGTPYLNQHKHNSAKLHPSFLKGRAGDGLSFKLKAVPCSNGLRLI